MSKSNPERMTTINISISIPLLADLRKIKSEHGVPVSKSIDLALRRYLKGFK